MAGKAEMRAFGADACEQVRDPPEGEPRHRKAEPLQSRGERVLRPGILRGDGGATDERLGQRQRIGEPAQSRNNSLIEVLARVRSSTRLTITTQASEGPGEPSGSGLPGSDPGITTE